MDRFQILSTAKEAVRPYVDRISIRVEAMEKGDMDLWTYSMSPSFDRAKHGDHNRAIAAVKELNFQLQKMGEEPAYTGDITNRQEVGRFCCLLLGREKEAGFVD
jgi:hypothetical protein